MRENSVTLIKFENPKSINVTAFFTAFSVDAGRQRLVVEVDMTDPEYFKQPPHA